VRLAKALLVLLSEVSARDGIVVKFRGVRLAADMRAY
jgi:hypothetical protein